MPSGTQAIVEHQMIATPSILAKKLAEKVSPEPMSGCWLWSGLHDGVGYGVIVVGHDTRFAAHRVSYSLYKGEIPVGMCVLHKCDVRSCCNPEHLFIGTKKQNSQDMVSKGRNKNPASLRTACPQGHPYSGVNAQGRRICKICDKATRQRFIERNKNV